MLDEQVSPPNSQFLAAFGHPIRARSEELTDPLEWWPDELTD